MNKKIARGAVIKVRIINPPDIQDMDENEIIVVNRIRLNAKLVECEIRNNNSTNVAIITAAIKAMKEQEKKSKRTVMGPKMSVRDVKKIFPDYRFLPMNSFAFSED